MLALSREIISDRMNMAFQVCEASKRIRTVFNKHVKSLDVAQGKFYIGCADSSIQVSEISRHDLGTYTLFRAVT